jgi:hypothetical protein
MKAELTWALHNIVAHPICEICHWAGYIFPPARRAGRWLHDATTPTSEAVR